MLLEIEKIWKVYFHTTIDLLLEIETPNLRVTIEDFAIAGDREKTGGQFTTIISIKYDLARSCFKFWLKIGDEGDKISRKKTGEALAETVFSRNFVTLGADFEGHNWKHDLARLCFMLYTPSYGNSQLKWKFWNLPDLLDLGIFFRNFEFFENFEKYEL